MDNELFLIEYDSDIVYEFNEFRCGNPYLDNYLYMADDSDYKVGKSYMCINNKKNDIIGYFTISPSSIILREDADLSDEQAAAYEEIHERTKMLSSPSLLIKKTGAIGIDCFAINEEYQGLIYDKNKQLKYSEYLLKMLFDEVKEVAKLLDTEHVVLYSTDRGRTLYHSVGFDFLNYNDKIRYYSQKNMKCPKMTVEEKERNNKYILIANQAEINSTPMIISFN